MRRLVAWGMVVLLLGSGAAMGIAVDRLWLRGGESAHGDREPHHRGPPPRAKRIFKVFKERLSLTPEQETEVLETLESVEAVARELHDSARPKIKAAMDAADARIRALLTAEQAPIYEELIAERKRRFERDRPPGHRRPPGHHGHHGPPPNLDANEDGVLSRDEVAKAKGPRAAKLLEKFSDLDTDQDGTLSREELRKGRPQR